MTRATFSAALLLILSIAFAGQAHSQAQAVSSAPAASAELPAAAASSAQAAASAAQPSGKLVVAGMPAKLYALPSRGNRTLRQRPTAIMVLGGSEGGTIQGDFVCPQLARFGYLCMTVQYHEGWGGEKKLTNVAIEPFLEALRWLSQQPNVQHVLLLGDSRGAEAAVLTALAAAQADSTQPGTHKLNALALFVPSAFVHPGIHTDPTAFVNAWTVKNQPVPSLPQFKLPASNAANLLKAIASAPKEITELAALPIEAVTVPVVAFGAGGDRIWPSGDFVRMLQARAEANNKKAMFRAVIHPNSGHRLLGTGPSAPSETYKWDGGSFTAHYGGTDEGNLAARNASWEELLELLAQSDKGPLKTAAKPNAP